MLYVEKVEVADEEGEMMGLVVEVSVGVDESVDERLDEKLDELLPRTSEAVRRVKLVILPLLSRKC